MAPECVPCLIRRVLFETDIVDQSKSAETVRDAAMTLGRLFGPRVCSASVATEVHRRVYEIIGNDDPYADLKRRSNEIALDLFPEAEQFVERSDDRLRAAFICAVVGNVLDFGIGTGFDDPTTLRLEFDRLMQEELGYDDTDQVRDMIHEGTTIAYLVDNCGEVVFDRLVLRELKRLGADLTLVVKEEPILTDATMKDIQGLGFEDIVDRIKEAPGFAVGLDIGALNGSFGGELRSHDLIIAKGMANFEALSETDIAPVAYLLRTKCWPVANGLGLDKDINAVKLVRGRGLPR